MALLVPIIFSCKVCKKRKTLRNLLREIAEPITKHNYYKTKITKGQSPLVNSVYRNYLLASSIATAHATVKKPGFVTLLQELFFSVILGGFGHILTLKKHLLYPGVFLCCKVL